ncbi:MAG TPA: DUF58 domain-containing protein [Candidatus Dormibacteraeota bacterium]|nr:DUF58 domain-containing protein [Candidatus Dormibacteraeota bacterium]
MTTRGALLLVVSLVPLVASNRVGALLWPGVAAFAAACLLCAADRLRAPGASRLRVARDHAPILSHGRPNPVRLTISIEGARPAGFAAVVRDEHPPDVAASVEIQRIVAGPAPVTLEYQLTPPTRGERAFGRTVVRVEGPLGLATRQSAVGAPDLVRVDPDLSALSAFEALARRGQLAELGLRTIRRPGEGTDFERIRDAVPDDPLRSINWRATARTGRLMAVELVPERAQPVVVCLDRGRLMGVGAGAMTKLDHAITAALLLVHVALRTGDRAGVLVFGDSVDAWVPPRPGRLQMRAILEAVRPVQPAMVESDVDEAFATFSRRQPRRALVVVFTDVLDTDQAASLIAQCTRLRRRHLPLVVTVRDPALDEVARTRPRDAEEVYARAVAAGLLGERAAVLRTLQRGGVETLDADARTLSPRLVNRYLALKRRGRL